MIKKEIPVSEFETGFLLKLFLESGAVCLFLCVSTVVSYLDVACRTMIVLSVVFAGVYFAGDTLDDFGICIHVGTLLFKFVSRSLHLFCVVFKKLFVKR